MPNTIGKQHDKLNPNSIAMNRPDFIEEPCLPQDPNQAPIDFRIRGSYPNYFMLKLFVEKGWREFEKDRSRKATSPARWFISFRAKAKNGKSPLAGTTFS